MVSKKRLIKLTQDLIKIDSQNPPGNESAIADFVKRYFDKLGVQTKIYEFKKSRSNVIAYFPASRKMVPSLSGKTGSRGKMLLLTPHLDTVPAGKKWRVNPFSGKILKNRLYGLGATDCKGNLACAMEAINSIIEDKIGLDYNLILAATADEESGSSLGLIPLLKRGIIKPDKALVLDSDDFKIIITQKGLIHLKVKIEGKRSHGAYPWRGINAIDIAVNIIQDIKKYKFCYVQNKYLKPPTINVGTIKGGDKVNIVADWCEFELDFRFLPGMSAGNIIKDIKIILDKHAKKYTLEIQGIQEPYYINEKDPLVRSFLRAMKDFKIKPVISGSEGATVITFFQSKNIPAIAAGFGSSGCSHITDEYVKIENLYKGALILEEFLKSYKFNNEVKYGV